MSCSRCHRNFNGNDYVIRARYHLYHIGCFRCDICRKNIVGGQEFASFQGKIYCSKDFETIIHRNARERKKVINASPNKTDVNLKTDDEQCESDDSSDDKEQDETCTRSGQRKEKATRVRTVLNEKQLYTLRTCYGANPRPDALLKEQLVEMTNLSPRVIRVWFQNKRCKDKKKAILMKQMQEHQKLRAIGHSAMPLIASDPISNEICVNEFVPQMDITTIHNPWISNDYINVPMQSTSTTGNEQHTIQQTFTLNQNQQLNNMQLNQQQNGLQQQSIRHRQPLQQPHHSQYQNSEQRGPHENNNDEDDFFDLMSSTDCRKNGDYFDLFDDLPDT
ncbi:hypothetical protein GJ496_010615 [Pomphorhynchus laevis]|nr:hypothetical protein GJ496_010615 [Pomphorhynchus laevis]